MKKIRFFLERKNLPSKKKRPVPLSRQHLRAALILQIPATHISHHQAFSTIQLRRLLHKPRDKKKNTEFFIDYIRLKETRSKYFRCYRLIGAVTVLWTHFLQILLATLFSPPSIFRSTIALTSTSRSKERGKK
jgi:hypothetical protein